jgi:hypothetical protein
MQGHILGEGTPVRETWLALVRTHLSLSVQAPLAGAAAAHERCRDSVAHRPSSYVGAHRSYHADQLVTRNVGKMYAVVVTGPRMPVTSTKTGFVHLDDHACGRWRRIGDCPDVYRTTEFVEDNRSHGIKSARTHRCQPRWNRRAEKSVQGREG